LSGCQNFVDRLSDDFGGFEEKLFLEHLKPDLDQWHQQILDSDESGQAWTNVLTYSRERKRDRETERQRDRETERQRDRETERQRDRETERQRDRETERQRWRG
jgi:hypothetical protein